MRFDRFNINNYHDSKRFTTEHFLATWASKTTIYQTLLRFEEGLGGKRKIWTGRKAEKLPIYNSEMSDIWREKCPKEKLQKSIKFKSNMLT